MTQAPVTAQRPSEPRHDEVRPRWWQPPDLNGTVTVGELATLVTAVGIGVVALVSLATAHLGVLSLGSVVSVSAGLAAVLLILVRVAGPLPKLVWDWPGLAVIAGAVLVAGLFFWPGFHYATGDRDPGGYVQHAFAMARGGSYDFIDEVLADPDLPVQVQTPGARFPGLWVADASTGRMVPQFYHLWPALLATGANLRGFGGVIAVTPILGVLAVALAVALARRVAIMAAGDGPFSLVAATVTGALLATNMLEVWQAKYPTAEMFAQVLFLGTSLGIVIAIQSRWRWAAGVAGGMLALGMLNRADGVLLVVAAIGLGCVLWVVRRFDARAWWFAGGLFVLLPYALWQAYGPARAYTLANEGPSLRLLLAGIVGSIVAALALRPFLSGLAGWVTRRSTDVAWQRKVGFGIVLLAMGLFGLAIIRPFVFGLDYIIYIDREVRSYDELNVYRLAWFFTWPGWLTLLGGIAVVALRRWRAAAWVVLLPLLMLLPLYALHAKNSPYLMWWGRRFVSTVIIGMVIMIAFGLAWLATKWLEGRQVGLAERLVGPAAAALLALFLFATNVYQSWPLRSHDEYGGSYGIGEQIAELAGDERGVFLWESATYCCAAPQLLWGGPLWTIHDQTSVLLPKDLDQVPAYVTAYADHFTDRPLFLLIDTPEAVPTIPGYDVTEVKRFNGGLQHWQESSDVRPDHAVIVPYDFTAYSVTPSETTAG